MFIKLCEKGFREKVPAGKEELYRERMEYEINILEETDNVDYCLIQYDTVNWAERSGILVGVGRGSAGGSLCLFLLGITKIDPIKYGLIFERFLIPERAGLEPDDVTIICNDVESNNYYQIKLENGRVYEFDRDSQFRVLRNGEYVDCYADELQDGDDIQFDNRDLIFTLNEV